MHYIGIDIGSTSAKVAVMDVSENILASFIMPTGWSSVETAETIKTRLSEMGYAPQEGRVVATGYGRVSVPYADKAVTEITCHGIGAAHIFNMSDMAVIDIGGQDTKVILLSGGSVNDFVMNDKCSAGTGRFLEIMSNALALTPASLCELARGGSGVKISSMCTVFAESEVISQLANGVKREDLIAGICASVASRVSALARRAGVMPRLCMSGGVARNGAVRRALEESLEMEIEVDPLAQYFGAIGAAIYAYRKATK